MQENVTDDKHNGGVQVTDVRSSVDDLIYDSKMVGKVIQDNTTHDDGYTIGRADCSVSVPVINPDYDMGCEDMDDVPTIESCRYYNTSPIVHLTDEFSKEGELTEKSITQVDKSCLLYTSDAADD